MTTNLKLALLAGLNLAVTALVGTQAVQPAVTTDKSTDANLINAASVASVEKSFIQVPSTCKARNAAFDPIVIGFEAASPTALSVHAALDLQGAGAVA